MRSAGKSNGLCSPCKAVYSSSSCSCLVPPDTLGVGLAPTAPCITVEQRWWLDRRRRPLNESGQLLNHGLRVFRLCRTLALLGLPRPVCVCSPDCGVSAQIRDHSLPGLAVDPVALAKVMVRLALAFLLSYK